MTGLRYGLLDRSLSRASPLPHLTAFPCWNSIKCGSGLAREGGGTGATRPPAAPYAHSTPAPTPAPAVGQSPGSPPG
ncbi:hypothetical protein DXU77_23570 [Pseudomonas lactis]|nr:hypothetical protein [Pseudomonas lactis]